MENKCMKLISLLEGKEKIQNEVKSFYESHKQNPKFEDLFEDEYGSLFDSLTEDTGRSIPSELEELYNKMTKLLASDSQKQIDFIEFFNRNKTSPHFLSLFNINYGSIYNNDTQVSKKNFEEDKPDRYKPKNEVKITNFPYSYLIESSELKRIDTNIASIAFWVKFWSILSIISLILWVIFSVMGINA